MLESFAATGKYPHLILSLHVHNYQRFTVKETGKAGAMDITCVVAGNGGYTSLGKLHKIDGKYPPAPNKLSDRLVLEKYDQDNFGFLRFEVTDQHIVGTYFSAPYQVTTTPAAKQMDKFTINLRQHTVK